mmetsp:Transcript_15415/g.15014  ORF Transcript_15415/g.15014 Transcript_15415/m.15014 type:complete len:181 (+) Transcript_15415:360-902(+)
MSEKIQEQLSIDNVVKRMRETKIVSFLTMNKQQRSLLPYMFTNLILTKPDSLKEQEHHDKQEEDENSGSAKSNPKDMTYAFRKKFQVVQMYKEFAEGKERGKKDIKLLNEEKQVSSGLEYVISKYNDSKLNQQILKNLVNFEEKDFAEQFIMIQNLNPHDESEDTFFEKNLDPGDQRTAP